MPERTKYMILIAVLIIFLLPFLIISAYVHPVADDFTYAFKGLTYGLFDNLYGEYKNWNGRYFSNVLVILNPYNYAGLQGYQMVSVILMLVTPLAFYLLLRTIFEKSSAKTGLIGAALVFTLLYINGMPQLAEGIYWYTGAVTYYTGNILFLLFASLLLMVFQNRLWMKSKVIHYTSMVVILLMINGLNEIHVVIMWLFLALAGSLFLVRNKRLSKVLLSFLVISFSFSLILIFSPGNEVRAAYFPEAGKFWHSLFMSSAQTVRFMTGWLFSLPLLFASLLFLLFAEKFTGKSPLISASFYLKPWLSLLLLPAVVFAGAFPAYWATGILGQHRTMNVAYFFFILLWFVNLAVFYPYLRRYRNTKWETFTRMAWLRPFLIIIFMISLAFTGNNRSVSCDLCSGRAASFHQQMNSRYSMLSSAGDTVVLKRIQDPPQSIMVQDVSVHSGDWVNRSYALYFSGGNGGRENFVVSGE